MVVRTALRRSVDPSLEAALAMDKPWTVYNVIKRFLLRFQPLRHPWYAKPRPVTLLDGDQISLSELQRLFNEFPIRGSPLSWLRRYPSCFHIFDAPLFRRGPTEPHVISSQRMAERVAAVDDALHDHDAMATRLVKLLMLSRGRRLGYSKISPIIRTAFGLPHDFADHCLELLEGEFPPCFELDGPSYIRLKRWDPVLARSAVEAAAGDGAPKFRFMLPDTLVKSRSKFDEFNDGIPYVSPYCEDWTAFDSLSPKLAEKRAVGVLHELLSLTLWKKLSILKLERFRREFGLPENLRQILMKHQGIFYVSDRYSTVVLREGYNGSGLVEKDPVVAATERLGELVQEGLDEYNRRRKLLNLEEQRKRGELSVRQEEGEEDKEEVLQGFI